MARLGWGVADQGISSLGNFAFAILVAKALSPNDFGAFSLAWVTYGAILNLSRGLATDPLVVRFSHTGHGAWKAAVQASTGTAVAVGALSGLLCVGVGSMLPQPVSTAIMALGPTAWRARLVNVMEPYVFHQHPNVAEIKHQLYRNGATYASMSGSGSSVYGIHRTTPPKMDWPDGHRAWIFEL